MRKVLSTLLIAGALVFAVTSLASGAQGARCGTLYTHKCTKPVITVRKLSSKCRAPSSTFTLPTIKVYAIAGIRRIKITLGSTVLKSKRFKGLGPQSYTIRHLKISTVDLKAGGHTIKVFVKDVKGKTATRRLHFSVCSPPPFTG